MKRALLILLVAATVLAVVGVLALSADNVQRLAENLISASLNREIRVEGTLSIDLGAPTRVVATSVRLANPDWVGGPTMAQAERVEVAIDPWTILGSGPLIVEELRVAGLAGELVRDQSGRANWVFRDEGTGYGATNLLVREIDLRATTLAVQLPDRDPVLVEVDRLTQEEGLDGLLETSIGGRINGRAVAADGRIGPFPNLLAGENVQILVDGDIGGLRVHSVGVIDRLASPRQPTLLIELAAEDAGDLAKTLGLGHSIEGAIELEFDVRPEGDGIALETEVTWGTSRFEARGSVADLPALDGVELAAQGTGEDMREAMQVFGMNRAPALPFRFDGQVSREGTSLQVDELTFTAGEFLFGLEGEMREFPSLNDASFEIEVGGADLEAFSASFGLPRLSAGAFSAEGQLDRDEDGRDRFRLAAVTELGSAEVSGTLGAAPDYLASRADLTASGASLRELGDVIGLPGLREEPFELTGALELVAAGYRLVEEATLAAGGASLLVRGVLGRKPLERGTDLSWRLSGFDLAELSAVSKLSRPLPSRQLDAAGRLEVEQTSLRLDGVEGTLGRVAFTLGGELARTEEFRGSDVRLSLSGPDLGQLEFLGTGLNLPAGAFKVSGRVQRTDTGLRFVESKFDVNAAQGRFDGELALPTDRLRMSYDLFLEGPDAAGFGSSYVDFELPPVAFRVEVKGEVSDSSWRFEEGLLRLAANEAVLSGEVQRKRPRGALRIRLDVPDVSEPGAWYGLKLPATNLELSGGLIREEDIWRLDNFAARSGKGDLAGHLAFLETSPPRAEADVRAGTLDLSWLIEVLEERSSDAAEALSSDRVIPDRPLPLERLREVDVVLSISAERLLLKEKTVENARAKLELEGGALRLEPVSFSGSEGKLEARFALTPEGETASMSLTATANDLRTGLFRPNQPDVKALPRGNWYMTLSSRGDTLRDLAANLNGRGKLESSSGRVANTRAQSVLLGPFFNSIFRAMNPFAEKEPYTDIVCSVFPFTISDGVMESAPSIVVQTEKLNMMSRGTIDLRTERLDLRFRSQARRGLGVSAGSVVNPLIRIGGTLASPSVNLDARGALVTGGAAIFTGGLSLLAQTAFGAAFRSSDPCGKALEESQKYFRKEGGE